MKEGDVLTSECREKFIDMTYNYQEFLERKGYNDEFFIQFKKKQNPNFNYQYYTSTMSVAIANNKFLLELIDKSKPIRGVFIDSLKEAVVGEIIRKAMDYHEHTDEYIKKTLKVIYFDYVSVHKKYFPDDILPSTLEEWNNRRDDYSVDPRL